MIIRQKESCDVFQLRIHRNRQRKGAAASGEVPGGYIDVLPLNGNRGVKVAAVLQNHAGFGFRCRPRVRFLCAFRRRRHGLFLQSRRLGRKAVPRAAAAEELKAAHRGNRCHDQHCGSDLRPAFASAGAPGLFQRLSGLFGQDIRNGIERQILIQIIIQKVCNSNLHLSASCSKMIFCSLRRPRLSRDLMVPTGISITAEIYSMV